MDGAAILAKASNASHLSERLGEVVTGASRDIRDGFTARHFSAEMFAGRMDPLLMVDHFVMTTPTFGPHLHAGISAVTVMFEDSHGGFINRDTLGHNLALKGGDLYWLAAAAGAAHEERPEDGAWTHALQIFVDLPPLLKAKPARAFLVRAADVSILQEDGYRVRVVLGRSGDAFGTGDTPEEMTLLDGFLHEGGRFSHRLPHEHQAWIYAVSGEVTIRVPNEQRALEAGTATTISAGSEMEIVLLSQEPSHFVLLAGKPIRESSTRHGPLVKSRAEDTRRTLAGHHAGRSGHIAG
jgi:redox-sensitive bicupin YhaK (pirin superfamily)